MANKTAGVKYINGKLYSIYKARKLFEIESETPDGRKTKIKQAIYRKNGGTYFLYTTIIYADDLSDKPTEFFRIVDEAAARKWVKDNATQEEYDRFCDLDAKREKVSFIISSRILEKIKREAAASGISLSLYIERILTDTFDDIEYKKED